MDNLFQPTRSRGCIEQESLSAECPCRIKNPCSQLEYVFAHIQTRICPDQASYPPRGCARRSISVAENSRGNWRRPVDETRRRNKVFSIAERSLNKTLERRITTLIAVESRRIDEGRVVVDPMTRQLGGKSLGEFAGGVFSA